MGGGGIRVVLIGSEGISDIRLELLVGSVLLVGSDSVNRRIRDSLIRSGIC